MLLVFAGILIEDDLRGTVPCYRSPRKANRSLAKECVASVEKMKIVVIVITGFDTMAPLARSVLAHSWCALVTVARVENHS